MAKAILGHTHLPSVAKGLPTASTKLRWVKNVDDYELRDIADFKLILLYEDKKINLNIG